jgi:hypothetical protein
MNELFPAGKKYFHNLTEGRRWSNNQLDWTAKVVCGNCNNTWMNEIEQEHAKPTISNLIVGTQGLRIDHEYANSIALFAFKTAVVLDRMNPQRPVSFFTTQARYAFREKLEIPCNVGMWMARFPRFDHGGCFTVYHRGNTVEHGGIQLYVCNYCVGHFAFQVVVEQKPTLLTLVPRAGFEHLAVPFWPSIPAGFVWPMDASLRDTEDFRRFGSRWNRVETIRFMGD